MAAQYQVRIYTPAGVLQEILTGQSGDGVSNENAGFLALSYTRGVNEIGTGAFVINAESGALDALVTDGEPTLDAQIEFWRSDSDNDIAPYIDFYGFQRDRHYDTDDNGVITYTCILEEQSDYLRRAVIAYRANDLDRSLFDNDPTETILKTLVTRNATASGTTADGRDRNVDAWGAFISVAADTAAGTSQTLACMGDNLYELLQGVAEAGGLDFSLVKTAARAWQFRTAALLGTDRSSGLATIIFSLLHGNMRRPKLYSNRRQEKTVCIVGGQGIDSARAIRTRTGDNYHATTNSYEMFYNGSAYTTTAGLDSAGDERLEELRARDALSFDVIQVPSTLYGKHYFLGDKVKALFLGKSYTPQIRRATVNVAAGSALIEDIQIEASDA